MKRTQYYLSDNCLLYRIKNGVLRFLTPIAWRKSNNQIDYVIKDATRFSYKQARKQAVKHKCRIDAREDD